MGLNSPKVGLPRLSTDEGRGPVLNTSASGFRALEIYS